MEILQVKDEAAKRSFLDLNELIIQHPAATFFVRAGADCEQAQIGVGDILVVDRSLTPVAGKMVVVISQGAFSLKKCELVDGKLTFVPLDVRKKVAKGVHLDVQIFGSVTYIIKKC